MRLPRTLLAFSFFVAVVFLTFFSLLPSHSSRTTTTSRSTPNSGVSSLFRAPFSLFPPNAIITLTHENSTAFLARPAAFGPSLPEDGLNGRVWIGSGFGDDAIRQGTAALGAVGELGCSDVSGWSGNYAKSGPATSGGVKSWNGRPAWVARSGKRSNNAAFDDADISGDPGRREKNGASTPAVNDGTDDYLNHLLRRSSVSKSNDPVDLSGKHADIQSIQEGAEIAGKIVLLSRGGCGFLEKVKWAQRRGAIALIVGDDTKGGPLIQMYAQGDTSNVSIPSVFTSRTTAHLLSSLVGSGNFIEDTVDEKGNPVLKVLHTDKPKKSGKKHTPHISFTPTTTATKAAVTAQTTSRTSKKGSMSTEGKSITTTARQPGWFKSLFFGSGKDTSKSDRSHRPSSGQLDWVIVEDWKADDRTKSKKASSKSNKNTDADVKNSQTDDGFVIGVQDWRDPDLVGPPPAKDTKADEKLDPATKNSPRPTKSGDSGIGGAKSEAEWEKSDAKDQKDSASREKSKGLLNAIFGDDDEDSGITTTGSSRTTDHAHAHGGDDEEYDGLWVTLTPTSGASPFLDTILVLVVSPLITLTVVYALLLLRSRIRRRHWRAPKSVVERLPVRTYQTIITPGNQSPRLPSPSSSSAATPLLQQSPIVRPQSGTTTEPRDAVGATSSPLQVPSPAGGSQEHEKNSGISPEWRKYMGKQVECVVCLEEYIDGVSRVMRLPCGHEFHADCM
jgi:hypothetical protein